jgi:polygalacturonase
MKSYICLLGIISTGVLTQAAFAAGTLNVVNDCGARGNGSSDDAPAIQACINRVSAGQTVYFPNGTYNLSKTLNIKGGISYVGESTNAVLHASQMANWIFMFPWTGANDITIQSLTFDQGGIDTNGNGEVPKNVHITSNSFRNNTQQNGNWTQHNFIFMDNGMSHSQIDHNSFYMLLANGSTRVNGNVDYDGDLPRAAIFSYGLDNTSIDHNTFDHVYQGIKVCQLLPYEAQNDYISSNTMTNVHRMGMEIQGPDGCGHQTAPGVYFNSGNFVIENNSLSNWDDYYWNSFGISFANPKAENVIVRNNTINAPPYYDAPGVPAAHPGIGIEVGGQPTEVYGNTLSGPWGQAIAVFSGSTGSQVYNNSACNVDVNASAPVISDENNPSPTDTYYHNNSTSLCN